MQKLDDQEVLRRFQLDAQGQPFHEKAVPNVLKKPYMIFEVTTKFVERRRNSSMGAPAPRSSSATTSFLIQVKDDRNAFYLWDR